MDEHKVKFAVVAYGPDGKARNVVELSEEDYAELERAMQWPEDLAAYDRLNRVINGAELGAPF
jgi:hypothetical protein